MHGTMGGGSGVKASAGKDGGERESAKTSTGGVASEDRGIEQQGAELAGVVFKDGLGNRL